MKGVYIFLANGFEEVEALAPVDILRRSGIDAKTVSIHNDKYVTGAHKVTVVADMTYGEFKAVLELEGTDESDLMVFPGGLPGSQHLADKTELINMMRLHYAEGGSVAAICAAPGLVLSQLSGINGKHFTCYDGFEVAAVAKGGIYEKKPTVTDGNIITGRGPGCAIEFALALVSHLKGEEVASAIRSSMMI